jgi:serine/threonine protein kinase/tetratricopeptide (TPR) repeat protein
MSTQCPKCSAENPDNHKFCGECATPLLQKEEVVHTKTLETQVEELTTGSIFAGRYKIIEEFGKGGMGKVYRVFDQKLNEEVALKLIKPEIAADRKTIERFKNELKLARKISHKNVGRMYEFLEDKDTHFITMEYVSGQDLRGLIRQTGQLTIGKAISIAKQICDGLSEAHSLGIVHRDLKPNNIMIDRGGNAKIMDFGIARALKDKSITGAGVVIGTPQYMSPEQVEGKDVDQRSDIYSLGIILYEMLTTRVPFEGDTPLTIGVKQKTEIPKAPKEFNERISDDLNQLILKCLEKERENRYLSATELKADLEKLEQGLPTTDRIVSPKKPVTSKEITVKITPKKLLIPALLFAAAAVIVIVLFLFIPGKSIKHSIAVITFENQTGSEALDYLRTVIPNLLISGLGQSKDIYVISWERMHDSLVAMGETETDIINTELGLKLCQREGIEAIVTGSFIKTGELFTTDVKVLEVESKNLLKSASTNGQGVESIMASQINYLAKEISRGLGFSARKAKSDQANIIDVTTSSMDAYKYYSLGKEAYRKSNFSDAQNYFERALVLDPEFAMAHYYLTGVYSSLGNTKAWRESWDNAIKYSKNASRRERLEIEANYARAVQGDEDKNIDILIQIQREFPQDKDVHIYLGRAYIRKGLEEDGIREYKTYIEAHPNPDPEVYYQLGSIFFNKREFEQALDYYQKFVSSSPDNPGAVTSVASTYFWMGDLNEAISQFEKALLINPEHSEAYFRIAYTYTLLEEYDKAFTYLEKASMMSPSSAQKAISLCWRSFLYYWLGRMEESLALSAQVPGMVQEVENKWIEGYGYFSKWLISSYRKEFEQSRQEIEAAIEYMAKYFPSRQTFDAAQKESSLAIIDIKEGKIANLSKRMAQIKALYEEEMPPWTEYTYLTLSGYLALAEQRFDDALADIKKAKEIESTFLSMLWNWFMSENINPLKDLRAKMYMEMGDLDSAIQAYEQITAFDPESADRLMIHPTWHYELAKLYEQKGESDKAIAKYEKFLFLWKDADPGLPEVDDAKERLAELRE